MSEQIPSMKKRLFLVDGMSNIFRAYYAVRSGLTNSKGIPTNAVFGFTMMLRRLITYHKPDYLGVVLDSKEKTFRHEQYEQYKANRAEMPDDLAQQLPYIQRVCEAFRVPILRLPRYEADDLMGTLACKAAREGVQAVIVSSDKDLCQLVRDDEIIVLRESKAGEEWYNADGVKERVGVRPEQVVDLLGLMGDSSDNIPGAPGIGEKGAVQIIEQFGSIEAALAGWEQVQKKTYRESLRDNAEIILKSRELARIDINAPVELDLKSLELEAPDPKAAFDLFSELEFQVLKKEFAESIKKAEADSAQTSLFDAPAASSVETKYRTFNKVAELDKLAKSLMARERFAFAVAGSTLGKSELENADVRSRLVGVAFSVVQGSADYFDLEHCDDRARALILLRSLLDNGLVDKVVHDYKHALWLLSGADISIEGVTDDTQMQAYLLDPERSKYELSEVAATHLGDSLNMPESAGERAAQQADYTLRLLERLSNKIEADGLDLVYRTIEMPLVTVLFDMERAGFRVDRDALKELSVEMQQELDKLTKRIHELAGREFNINSPQQLGEVFEQLNFEVSKRTATGKISTDKAMLDELAEKYELPRLVIEFRELAKLRGTYVDAFPSLISQRDGRIHTTLNQTATATGRLSSTNPNLQNIPIRTEMGRRIRRAFIPADNCVLLSADYSQIELRLLAHFTRDPVMLEAFRQGEDIHDRTAREVFGAKTDAELKEKRRVAKIVNFAIAYVVGPFGLAPRVGLTRHEAKKVINDYYRTYAGVKKYMDELPDKARAEHCVVRSLSGRLRRIPQLEAKGQERARAEREAINMPMQGSASDIIKLAMLKVHEALKREKLQAQMILQVHDELVLEVPKAEVEKVSALVKKAMEQAAKTDVPLVVETGSGENWMDAKP
jgi:DNA polymerase-1